jgi:hypothetical protein
VAGPPSWRGGSGWAMDSSLDSVRFSFSPCLWFWLEITLYFLCKTVWVLLGGFVLDETLGYGKLRIKVNNFMGFGWKLLEMKFKGFVEILGWWPNGALPWGFGFVDSSPCIVL